MHYRLYTLDAAGHIVRAPVEFQAASDQDAIQQAQEYRDSAKKELWHQARLVAPIPPLVAAG